jgi:hypothetical protein
MKQVFILRDKTVVEYACQYLKSLSLDSQQLLKVVIDTMTRTGEQNAKFHAICGDIAKSKFKWMGKERTEAQWKVLLVSGHAVATKEGSEVTVGLEGEYINLRESTALMSKTRGSSLIEYSVAWCISNGIKLNDY